jgi:hypothetical protein
MLLVFKTVMSCQLTKSISYLPVLFRSLKWIVCCHVKYNKKVLGDIIVTSELSLKRLVYKERDRPPQCRKKKALEPQWLFGPLMILIDL